MLMVEGITLASALLWHPRYSRTLTHIFHSMPEPRLLCRGEIISLSWQNAVSRRAFPCTPVDRGNCSLHSSVRTSSFQRVRSQVSRHLHQIREGATWSLISHLNLHYYFFLLGHMLTKIYFLSYIQSDEGHLRPEVTCQSSSLRYIFWFCRGTLPVPISGLYRIIKMAADFYSGCIPTFNNPRNKSNPNPSAHFIKSLMSTTLLLNHLPFELP